MLPCFHQQSNSRLVLVLSPRVKGTSLWAVRPMLSTAAMLTEWLPTENAVRSLITIGQLPVWNQYVMLMINLSTKQFQILS